MKPVIGITCPWSEETWGPTTAGGGYDYVGRAYVSAIYRAGAMRCYATQRYKSLARFSICHK